MVMRIKQKHITQKMRVAQLESELARAAEQYAQNLANTQQKELTAIKQTLSNNNCALGINSSNSFTLFASDGSCNNFKSIENLMHYFNEHYAS